jgi:hypothetical protein
MEMLDWVKDCRQMNLITNVAKKFTMSPNPIVKIKCTTFEIFTTIERI